MPELLAQLGLARSSYFYHRARVKVVQRLMKQESLVVAKPKRRRYGSYLGEIGPAPENLINRDFHAVAPSEKWLTDIT